MVSVGLQFVTWGRQSLGRAPPTVAGTCCCHFSWPTRKQRIDKEVTLLLQLGHIISQSMPPDGTKCPNTWGHTDSPVIACSVEFSQLLRTISVEWCCVVKAKFKLIAFCVILETVNLQRFIMVSDGQAVKQRLEKHMLEMLLQSSSQIYSCHCNMELIKHLCMHTCTHTLAHAYTCTYAHTLAHTYSRARARTHAHAHAHVKKNRKMLHLNKVRGCSHGHCWSGHCSAVIEREP